MSAKKENASILGVGVTACTAYCAGPLLGVLGAVGLGTASGFALFGTIAVLVGAGILAAVMAGRRRRAQACSSSESSVPVPVEMTNVSPRS